MKSKIIASSITFAGLMVIASAVQAQSINVSVIGTVIPAACVPALAGGGVADYGDIPAGTLNATAFNVLAQKAIAFTINCEQPAMVGISAVDNRSSSVVPGITVAAAPGFSDLYNYGLGTVSGANVGGFAMTLEQGSFTVDGVATPTLLSQDTGVTWGATGLGGIRHTANNIISWGATPAAGPLAGRVFAGTLTVQAVLNKGSALPLTANVPLDGSATLSLVYL